METISWYITSTQTRFSTSKYAKNSCTCLFDLQTMKFGVDTTETGRPRIQRYEWQLILSPKVNDLGHVALFFKPKMWTQVVTFLSVW